MHPGPCVPRATHFHNGFAADLDAVVDFDDERFHIGFIRHDKVGLGRVEPPAEPRGRHQPNCTERRVIAPPNQNPVIGKLTGLSPEAPAATITGTKCSWVGSDSPTPGARLR